MAKNDTDFQEVVDYAVDKLKRGEGPSLTRRRVEMHEPFAGLTPQQVDQVMFTATGIYDQWSQTQTGRPQK